MPQLVRRPRSLCAADGFTLVELLVAMACSIVIMLALTGVMIVTMDQSQNTFTREDATRQARTALANLENQLHSACVNGTAPVQGASDGNNLAFVSYIGTSDTPQAVWHDVTYDPVNHTLTDNTSPATYVSNSTGSYWTTAGPSTPVQLLQNVQQLNTGEPVFQYFGYESFPDANNNLYWAIPDGSTTNPLSGAALQPSPYATPLGANATKTVEVEIDMLVGPTSETLNNSNLTSTLGDPVTDTVSLRLTTPPDFTPAGTSASGYGPCQ
jgi:type II secretory pathway pseudopilin PulG